MERNRLHIFFTTYTVYDLRRAQPNNLRYSYAHFACCEWFSNLCHVRFALRCVIFCLLPENAQLGSMAFGIFAFSFSGIFMFSYQYNRDVSTTTKKISAFALFLKWENYFDLTECHSHKMTMNIRIIHSFIHVSHAMPCHVRNKQQHKQGNLNISRRNL